MGTISRRSIW
eukprot:gene20519-26614_t